jgi:hypothetical protein
MIHQIKSFKKIYLKKTIQKIELNFFSFLVRPTPLITVDIYSTTNKNKSSIIQCGIHNNL